MMKIGISLGLSYNNNSDNAVVKTRRVKESKHDRPRGISGKEIDVL